MLYRFLAGGATALMLCALIATALSGQVQAAQPGTPAFQRTWDRTDKPVAESVVARTWMWGPEASAPVMEEQYEESPGGMRQVQYFDKARMEITQPGGDTASVWYVTNGLLVVELMTGKMQVGDNRFEDRNAAEINVAGDADDPSGPTYHTFGPMYSSNLMDAPPRVVGATITERVARNGVTSDDPSLASQGVTVGYLDTVTSHAIAAPFWDFMNANGMVYQNGQYVKQPLFQDPFFATGRPITEAYWAEVKVGGVQRQVLMQCFERRCLTYTPGNPAGFVVEAGNVGQHYHAWRYADGGDPDPDPDPTPMPTPTPTPTPDPEPDTATEYVFAGKFGLPSLNVELDSPHKVAVAPTGEVYVANSGRNEILKFAPDGFLITKWGSEGSGNGQFNTPVGVTIDPDGDVYVTDFGNHRVQKFDANGAFITAWGAVGASNGNFDGPWDIVATEFNTVYVTDLNNNRIQVFDSDGKYLTSWGSQGSANGQFLSPLGIDFSPSGHVYVADSANSRIQIFSATGDWINSHGSFGTADGQFSIVTDVAVAVAADPSYWTTELGTDRVQVFNAAGSHVLTIDQGFENPMGIAFDSAGEHAYIASVEGNDVRVLRGADLESVWTDDAHGRFGTSSPTAMAISPDGTLYVIDRLKEHIKVLSPDFVETGRIDFELTPSLRLDEPLGAATDRNGNLYLADNVLQIVIKLDPDGRYIAQFGGPGDVDGKFSNVKAVAVDDAGNIYAGDEDGIQKFGPDFSFIASSRVFADVTAIAIYGDEIYATHAGSTDQVAVYDPDLNVQMSWGSGFDDPSGIATDDDGFIYVTDELSLIQKFRMTREGTTTGISNVAKWSRPGSGDGEIGPSGYPGTEVIVDGDGFVYVSDPENQRIQFFVPAGAN